MPDLKDVFRMATENVRPDPGALERQHREQRWHVAKQKAGVYALVAGLVAAAVFVGIRTLRQGAEESPTPGTAPSAPVGVPPTVESLAGIWLVDDDDPLLGRFSTDGTFAFDNIGALDTDPAAAGTYEVDGRIISFTNGRSRICSEGDRYAWRAGLTEAGRLHVFHEDVLDDVAGD